MNTGENIYLSSRVSSPLYDIGAWLYFITGSIDIAFFSKYIVLTLFTATGLVQLIKRSILIENRISNTKFLIFAVLLASMIFLSADFFRSKNTTKRKSEISRVARGGAG
jgi:hypothetical protein